MISHRYRSEEGEGETHRSRKIGTSDSLDGSIEVVESLGFHDLGADLRSDTESRESSLNSNQSSENETRSARVREKRRESEKERTGWSS